MATIRWLNPLTGAFDLAPNWDTGQVPGPVDDAVIAVPGGYDVRIATAIAIGSLAVTNAQATVVLSDPVGSHTIAGPLTNAGTTTIDTGFGQGGSSLSIAGTLTNTNFLQIGNGGLGAATTVTVGDLVDTGRIDLTGNTGPGAQATLVDAAAATATLAGTINLAGNALLQYASGGITTLTNTAQLTLSGANARVAQAGQTTTSTALAGLAANAGTLTLANGATLAIAGPLTNTGTTTLDTGFGQGGASLSIAGTLTNTNFLQIGNGGLGAATTVTVGDLVDTGRIDLTGNTGPGAVAQATLVDAAAASATLAGTINLAGNALLQYASGGITTLTSTAQLTLSGANARVAQAGQTTTSTALAGLAANAGTLTLANGAALAIAGPLSNAGTTTLDTGFGQGGSSLSIAGTLTNTNFLQIGNGGLGAATTVTVGDLVDTGRIDLTGNTGPGAVAQATLVDAAAASATLAGTINLAGNALLQYASGGITTLTSTAQLTLSGANARVAQAGQTTTSTALAGLAANAGTLTLSNSATLAIAGPLTNTGTTTLDTGFGQGGASLSIAGTLTNTNFLQIGNGGLGAATTVTVGDLVDTGRIDLTGNTGPGAVAQATLVDAAAASATLAGTINLAGNALLQYASGGITTLTSAAQLTLSGANARVAQAGQTTTSTALAGLAANAGTLGLANGATLAIAGPLTNTGTTTLDTGFGQGGASLSIAGTLTNTNFLQIGNGGLGAATTVTVGDLVDTGRIDLTGNTGPGAQATLVDAAAASATLAGTINLAGNALLQYASGGITTLTSTAQLTLSGANARVAQAGQTTTSTALAGLAANAGTLTLANSATLAIAGPLTNTGTTTLDTGFGQGGASLSVSGTLTNTGFLQIGNAGLSAATTLATGGLANAGALTLFAAPTRSAALTATGDVANTGTLSLGAATLLDATGRAYAQSAGTAQIDGTLRSTTITLSGGTLDGTGTLVGNLRNDGGGTIFGGDTAATPGTLTITGSYEQSGTGLLQVDITGTAPAQTSRIALSGGTVDLAGGTLQVLAGSGFAFALGQSFTVLTFAPGALTGRFAAINAGAATGNANGVSLGNGLSLQAAYDNTQGQIRLDVVAAAISNPASGSIAPALVDFGNLHTNDPAQRALAITNTAPAPAENLGASAAGSTGDATASGQASLIAAGATNSTGITVGIDTSRDGPHAGTVTIALLTDPGNGNTQPLPSQTVDVRATAYNLATPALSVPTRIVHQGDAGTITLTLTNAAPVDGFSETLGARIVQTSGGVAPGAGAGPITLAPGATDSTSLTFAYSAALAGAVAGTVTLAFTSDGGTGPGSLDGLGQTGLAPRTVDIGVLVDNYAAAAFLPLAGGGTLSGSGTSFTLDLGTIRRGYGPFAVGFGVRNAATGLADLLAGTFSATGSSAFTVAGLGAFAGLAAGQSDTAPSLVLDTSAAGTFTETVTLTPTGSNASGYSAALPTLTLAITGRVADVVPPTIAAPPTLAAFQATPIVLPTFALGTADSGQATLLLEDAAGQFRAAANSRLTVTGNNTNRLAITGLLADIRDALPGLTYAAAATGTETVTATIIDDTRSSAATTLAVTTTAAPRTIPVLNSPVSHIVIPGRNSGIGGLSVSDPASQASGQPVTVVFSSRTGILTVTGDYGGTILGQGTDTLAITGTVQQINDYLGDGLLESLGTTLANNAFDYTVTKTIGFIKTGTIELLPSQEEIVTLGGGPEGKFFTLGVVAASFALDAIIGAIPGNTPPSRDAFIKAIVDIIGDPHILTPTGALYDFNAVGEFVLATSNQPGDSFDVQVRLTPFNNSPYATAMTQLAAAIGPDRVSFATGRAATVWLNGIPVGIDAATPLLLAGGEVERVADAMWRITWNTGEVLTVTNSGSFLGASIAPGPNNPAGSLLGLATLSDTQANQFQLPDGSILRQPLDDTTLYGLFADAWRVPQAFSLLDYAPGQTTADFTQLNRPAAQITLADLPAAIVAQGNAAAAAAGITDPGAVAAIAFDYVISGGDPAIVAADAAFLTGLATTPTPANRAGPAPLAIGILADAARVRATGTTDTAVAFDVYLTAAAVTDTLVAYAVVAASGTLGAAAFGGTLPSGTVTIPAGARTAQFSVVVPAAGLGLQPSSQLQVQLSSPAGTPVLAGTAQVQVTQPVPGPPPIPVLTDLTRFGSFLRLNATTYRLDLGEIQYGSPVPDLRFAIANAATGRSDTLGGTFTVAPVEGFGVTGAALPQGLDAGQSYAGLVASVIPIKFGYNDETIVFRPVDTNSTGFDVSLDPITLIITDTIVPPTMVFSYAYADVHIVTYNGLHYDFQAVGEFTLAKSRVAGDSFDIQLRLEPYGNSQSASIITQTAVSLGADRVTFDLKRPDFAYLNGAPLDPSVPVTIRPDGTITRVADGVYTVDWATGETATITNAGRFINVADGIPLSLPNLVGGLQGEDAGAENDFQLSDGTVLAQPLSSTVLYGSFADSWRVSQGASLFDYLPGQTTQTFTDRGFPRNPIRIADLPQDLVQAATLLATTAGITDANLINDAVFDYVATNDPATIAAAAAVNARIAHTNAALVITAPPALPAAGIVATPRTLVEIQDGPTTATFRAYLTAPAATDTVIAYAVIGASTGDLPASAFGGAYPTGTVTIPAGQSSASFGITVPQGALGTRPAGDVEVRIAATNPILAGTAAATITNALPQPGTPPILQLAKLTVDGILVREGNAYVIDLGTLVQNQTATTVQLALLNTAAAPADDLGGSFTAPLGDGFTIFGNRLATPIQAGQRYDGLFAGISTTVLGTHSETFTFTPTDRNASGYSVTLDPITITIRDTVAAPALGVLNSPGTIIFPNVRINTPESRPLSVTNSAAAPAASLAVSAAATGQAAVSGAVAALAAGETDSTSLAVGLDTSAAGRLSGTVVLTNRSGTTPANPALSTGPVVDVFGAAYRPAAAAITGLATIVHVGDSVLLPLAVRNAVAADAYSETLVATAAAATPGLAASGTARVAAGQTDAASLRVAVDTASPGVFAGTVTVGLATDGGTGAESIDGLGLLPMAAQDVAVSITVDAYAAPVLQSLTGPSLSSAAPGSYLLDLGTVALNAAPVGATLSVRNAAAGPADLLSGGFGIAGSGAFANAGFTSFAGLGAGQAGPTLALSLATATAGRFSETITLSGTGSNASGYAGALAPVTLTVTGVVASDGIRPFATLRVGSTDPTASLTVQAAASPALAGAFTDLAGGTLAPDGRTYSVTGTAAQVAAALAAAAFQPDPGAPAIAGVVAALTGGGMAGTARLATTGNLANDLTIASPGDVVTAGSGADTLRAGAGGAILVGGPGRDVLIGGAGGSVQIGGTGDTTYFSQGGPARIVGGSGQDTVQAASGNVIVNTGRGGTLVGLGSGTALVSGSGADTIVGGSGTAVIGAASNSLVGLGSGSATISAASGTTVVGGSGAAVVGVRGEGILLFTGTGPTTFVGGTGSSTVYGGASGRALITAGAGGGLFSAGTGGGSTLVGGQKATTLVGGGSGDILFANGAAGTILQAGAGNETLQGGASSGNDTFFAGPGETLIGLGSGQDAVFAGTGRATVVGGSGRDVYAFAQGRAGGQVSIIGFKTGTDQVSLQGYAPGEIQRSLATTTTDPGAPNRAPSATITLSDNTQITFLGLASLDGRIYG